MLLAIDIGNTNTVFAVFQGDTLVHSWRCQTNPKRSADEYAAFLKALFSLSSMTSENFDDVIISSVVPEANFHIRRFCEKYLERDPFFVTAKDVNLHIDLEHPGDIGADRIVNAIAVNAHYQMPAIVVDFGTATTFDVIDGQGRYAGGAIAPGIHLSVSALEQAAAKLPSVDIKKPGSVIGKNTTQAIQSGIYWGYMGLIEGIIGNIAREIGAAPYVIATGGLATLFAQNTDAIHTVDNELIFKGLLQIYTEKRKAN